ncbi:hypothetical protein GGI15_003054 [Coemansia interrupta]|uniref:Protein kinase domain-containing protein n=1 Tax=Coemansia interrupta TaxID=1126814 RepID=A0A9W8HHB8_9FUNG|nr:hypothetical protein GGI15_003054 [Coemansia interrupta]
MPPTETQSTARGGPNAALLLDTITRGGLSSSDTLTPLPAEDTARRSVRVDRSRVLGAGQYSTVCLGTLVTRDGEAEDMACAIKIPHANNLDARELGLIEAAGLAHVGAGATVRCFGLVDLQAAADEKGLSPVMTWAEAGERAVAGGEWGLVLELCEGGTCWEWMLAHRAQMNAELFFHWARQLATALAALEAAAVAHKDIKGHNMLIDSCGNIRLADFTAMEFSAEALSDMKHVCPALDPASFPAYTDFSGTIPYSAPEALAFNSAGGMRSPTDLHKMDIYSAGVSLYTLFVSGAEPYAAVKSSVEQMLLASRGAFWEWEERHYLTTLPNRADTAPPSPVETPDTVGKQLAAGLARSLSLGPKPLGRRRTLRNRDKTPREYKRFLSGELLPTKVEDLLREMTHADPKQRPDATQVLQRLDSMELDVFEPTD